LKLIDSGFYKYASPDGVEKNFARLRVLRAFAFIPIFPSRGGGNFSSSGLAARRPSNFWGNASLMVLPLDTISR